MYMVDYLSNTKPSRQLFDTEVDAKRFAMSVIQRSQEQTVKVYKIEPIVAYSNERRLTSNVFDRL